jgi:iron complex transport system ATP-binding protein
MTIEAFDITAGYSADKPVLANESIAIKRGMINIILGKNGCGKSTLLKALCRQLKISSGCIKLNDIDMVDLSRKALAKKVGILFQENEIPRSLNVRDLVGYGRFAQTGLFSGTQKADLEKIEEAMQLTGTTKFSDKPVSSLSSGQRQLVWIAMLIAQEAEYLFLDEPTTYLDLKNQFEIMNCLVKLKEEKHKTIVAILHDINLALQYADWLFILDNGKIVDQGDPASICKEKGSLLENVFEVKMNITLKDNGQYTCVPVR